MVVLLLIRLREHMLRTVRVLLLLALFFSLLVAVYGVIRTDETVANKEIQQHEKFGNQGLSTTANGENWFLITKLKQYYCGE
ncbi:MAG: hypothetical protein AB1374_08770 [Bacillota bacterium]